MLQRHIKKVGTSLPYSKSMVRNNPQIIIINLAWGPSARIIGGLALAHSLMAVSNVALADCSPDQPDPGPYTCSGSDSSAKTFSVVTDDLEVTADTGYVLHTLDDNGFSLEVIDDGQDLRFVQKSTGSITANKIGIYADNKGKGSTYIDTAGEVVGERTYGIYVTNSGDSQDINIAQTAGSISGGAIGIIVSNNGTESTYIDTAGEVVGEKNYGIQALNSGSSKDITITQTAGSINGNNTGLKLW